MYHRSMKRKKDRGCLRVVPKNKTQFINRDKTLSFTVYKFTENKNPSPHVL